MKPTLLLLAAFCSMVAAAPSENTPLCPETCVCQHEQVTCTSDTFLEKITPKQIKAITHLSINSGGSLTKIDPRLKYLKNLQALDLSNNTINASGPFPPLPNLHTLVLRNNSLKTFNFKAFPKSVENLDLSLNDISTLSEDYTSLRHLKMLQLSENPIDCAVEARKMFERMLNYGVRFPDNVKCFTPVVLQNKSLNSVITDTLLQLNGMIGDQEQEDSDENEFIRTEDHSDKISAKTEHSSDDLFEGSGEDEGSGFGEIPKACTFNCTEFKPIEGEEESSPLTNIKEGFKIFWEDVFGTDQATTANSADEKDKPQLPSPNKEHDEEVNVETDKVSTNHTVLAELERASVDEADSKYTYYLVGIVLLLMVCVIIFIVLKRKQPKSKRRNAQDENGIGEEMKPLGNKLNGVNGGEVRETLALPEKVPLMETAPKNGDHEVTLRVPLSHSPQPERVTITAGEIPDSIPKTPQLVHREMNSNGEMVTRAVDS